MQIGFHLTPFWSPTDRPATQIIDEAIRVVAASSTMGYSWVSVGHHWMSYPTVWPQPFPILARLAPETGAMRLKTSMVLAPLLNPVDLAENVATLDHISHGRLDLGIAIGYREQELAAAFLTRKDRVPKLLESIELMKRLWSGETVTYEGRYAKITEGRMGFRPFQLPHPPIEMGAQSEGASRRAARVADSVFFGPQVGWSDIVPLATVYRDERRKLGKSKGIVGASRSLMVGASKEDAARKAGAYLEKTFSMYRTWEMQELTMSSLRLDSGMSLDDWAIYGSPSDCVEVLLRARDEGLERVGFTIYSLPPSVEARIEYLQWIAEEIVAKVTTRTAVTVPASS
ncbi:MAG: LLM class flavin-dependent oxidoreductase [Chloroflexi bacterium]|nr:LLM class flavin-dependent oxidoreductase [Chloroflexota bacterium]